MINKQLEAASIANRNLASKAVPTVARYGHAADFFFTPRAHVNVVDVHTSTVTCARGVKNLRHERYGPPKFLWCSLLFFYHNRCFMCCLCFARNCKFSHSLCNACLWLICAFPHQSAKKTLHNMCFISNFKFHCATR